MFTGIHNASREIIESLLENRFLVLSRKGREIYYTFEIFAECKHLIYLVLFGGRIIGWV